MSITIDASEIAGFGGAMAAAPAVLKREMAVASAAAIAEGIGLAQANAPVDEGVLRASIGVIERPTATGGSFGTSVEYAWMREEGGTITGHPWLVFQTRDGRWVKVRSVTQRGTRYMGRAAGSLEDRLPAIYGLAVERVLAGIVRAAD